MLSKPEKGAILEMCYNPRTWTDICQVAQDNFWTVITGDIAMIWQGIEQQKIWLNCVSRNSRDYVKIHV
jgi:quinate dehydrogenase